MGCEGSKQAQAPPPAVKPQARDDPGGAGRRGSRAAPAPAREQAASPPPVQNGGANGLRRQGSSSRGMTKTGSWRVASERRGDGDDRHRAWRFVYTAQWVADDEGQKSNLLGPLEEAQPFEQCVKSAFSIGDRGYTLAAGEWRPPPDGVHTARGCASQGVAAADVAAAAQKVGAGSPAVAAFTLVSPLCNAAAGAMTRYKEPAGGGASPFGHEDDTAAEGYAPYRPYLTLLHKQLLALPQHEGVCFKLVPFGASGAYAPSSVVTWAAPMPTSKSLSTAAAGLAAPRPSKWVNAPGAAAGWTCLVIQSRTGRLVDKVSVAPQEEEVVFLANTQFRTSHRVSSALKAVVMRGMAGRMPDPPAIDFLLLTEVRLVVWKDVLVAMDEVERALHKDFVNLLEQATDRAERDRCYAWDVVSQAHVLGSPMEVLPPRGAGGNTVVHLAAEAPESLGLLKLVTYHLSPQDIDEANADGRSPVHLALCLGNQPAVLQLLLKGASVTSLGSMADAALATAIRARWATQRPLVERLFNQVDGKDSDTVFGSKLVMQALGTLGTQAAAKPLVDLLLGRLDRVHHIRHLPLAAAVRAACETPGTEAGFVRWLMEEGDVNPKDVGDGVGAAIEARNYSLLKPLEQLQVTLNGGDANGRTAAHIAAARCDVDGLTALRNAGANLAGHDASGWTPAHDAAYRGHTTVLNLLAKWKMPLNEPDVDGCTPLWWAADTGRLDCAQQLLNHKADPNTADASGTTAMMIAAYNGHADVVALLEKAGGGIDRRNKNGQTAAWLAAAVGSVAVLKVLKAADVGSADARGWTAAHVAAQEGWVEVLVYLTQHKPALLQHVTEARLTPLHLAVSKSRFRSVAYLVSAGADVAAAGQDPQLGSGTTPLHIAASKDSFKDSSCLPLLINPHTVNAACTCGSPLDVAHLFGRYQSANLLRERGGESARLARPEENMAQLPDNIKDVHEVVFRHPATLPEKNMPGAVIRITTTNGDRFMYTLNGEERPPFRRIHLYHGSHGLALKFPDAGATGRQVYLPVTGVREILAGLLCLGESISISLDLRQEFKAMTENGQAAPLRRAVSSKSRLSMTKKPSGGADGPPTFQTAAYVSDAAPYAFSTMKVVAHYTGGEEGASLYQWYRAQVHTNTWVPVKPLSNVFDESGSSYAYYATADDLGCQLKTVCTPVRKDGTTGAPKETKVAALQWPPHLGCTIVDKIADGVAAIKVDCEIAGEHYRGLVLQLIEDQLKVKHPSREELNSLAAGTMDARQKIRCVILAADKPMFDIRGLSVPVTVTAETRVDRDFLVTLIRAWCACCDGELSTAMLGADFEREWAMGLPAEGDAAAWAARVDTIWNAFEDRKGIGQLNISESFPKTAQHEARQTLATLRLGFAAGQMRRPPTKSR
eukprot:TRINITY_DN4573_c1_g3_i1.p1 TRINITY_DN4573_c1_g3~~TRINITY_DN4573_c1_g3_i1.p1  ORF type:complete len:1396 (+),score=445.68 TRINITY_DN4573_c1_g3_i1:127-4314(+)